MSNYYFATDSTNHAKSRKDINNILLHLNSVADEFLENNNNVVRILEICASGNEISRYLEHLGNVNANSNVIYHVVFIHDEHLVQFQSKVDKLMNSSNFITSLQVSLCSCSLEFPNRNCNCCQPYDFVWILDVVYYYSLRDWANGLMQRSLLSSNQCGPKVYFSYTAPGILNNQCGTVVHKHNLCGVGAKSLQMYRSHIEKFSWFRDGGCKLTGESFVSLKKEKESSCYHLCLMTLNHGSMNRNDLTLADYSVKTIIVSSKDSLNSTNTELITVIMTRQVSIHLYSAVPTGELNKSVLINKVKVLTNGQFISQSLDPTMIMPLLLLTYLEINESFMNFSDQYIIGHGTNVRKTYFDLLSETIPEYLLYGEKFETKSPINAKELVSSFYGAMDITMKMAVGTLALTTFIMTGGLIAIPILMALPFVLKSYVSERDRDNPLTMTQALKLFRNPRDYVYGNNVACGIIIESHFSFLTSVKVGFGALPRSFINDMPISNSCKFNCNSKNLCVNTCPMGCSYCMLCRGKHNSTCSSGLYIPQRNADLVVRGTIDVGMVRFLAGVYVKDVHLSLNDLKRGSGNFICVDGYSFFFLGGIFSYTRSKAFKRIDATRYALIEITLVLGFRSYFTGGKSANWFYSEDPPNAIMKCDNHASSNVTDGKFRTPGCKDCDSFVNEAFNAIGYEESIVLKPQESRLPVVYEINVPFISAIGTILVPAIVNNPCARNCEYKKYALCVMDTTASTSFCSGKPLRHGVFELPRNVNPNCMSVHYDALKFTIVSRCCFECLKSYGFSAFTANRVGGSDWEDYFINNAELPVDISNLNFHSYPLHFHKFDVTMNHIPLNFKNANGPRKMISNVSTNPIVNWFSNPVVNINIATSTNALSYVPRNGVIDYSDKHRTLVSSKSSLEKVIKNHVKRNVLNKIYSDLHSSISVDESWLANLTSVDNGTQVERLNLRLDSIPDLDSLPTYTYEKKKGYYAPCNSVTPIASLLSPKIIDGPLYSIIEGLKNCSDDINVTLNIIGITTSVISDRISCVHSSEFDGDVLIYRNDKGLELIYTFHMSDDIISNVTNELITLDMQLAEVKGEYTNVLANLNVSKLNLHSINRVLHEKSVDLEQVLSKLDNCRDQVQFMGNVLSETTREVDRLKLLRSKLGLPADVAYVDVFNSRLWSICEIYEGLREGNKEHLGAILILFDKYLSDLKKGIKGELINKTISECVGNIEKPAFYENVVVLLNTITDSITNYEKDEKSFITYVSEANKILERMHADGLLVEHKSFSFKEFNDAGYERLKNFVKSYTIVTNNPLKIFGNEYGDDGQVGTFRNVILEHVKTCLDLGKFSSLGRLEAYDLPGLDLKRLSKIANGTCKLWTDDEKNCVKNGPLTLDDFSNLAKRELSYSTIEDSFSSSKLLEVHKLLISLAVERARLAYDEEIRKAKDNINEEIRSKKDKLLAMEKTSEEKRSTMEMNIANLMALHAQIVSEFDKQYDAMREDHVKFCDMYELESNLKFDTLARLKADIVESNSNLTLITNDLSKAVDAVKILGNLLKGDGKHIPAFGSDLLDLIIDIPRDANFTPLLKYCVENFKMKLSNECKLGTLRSLVEYRSRIQDYSDELAIKVVFWSDLLVKDKESYMYTCQCLDGNFMEGIRNLDHNISVVNNFSYSINEDILDYNIEYYKSLIFGDLCVLHKSPSCACSYVVNFNDISEYYLMEEDDRFSSLGKNKNLILAIYYELVSIYSLHMTMKYLKIMNIRGQYLLLDGPGASGKTTFSRSKDYCIVSKLAANQPTFTYQVAFSSLNGSRGTHLLLDEGLQFSSQQFLAYNMVGDFKHYVVLAHDTTQTIGTGGMEIDKIIMTDIPYSEISVKSLIHNQGYDDDTIRTYRAGGNVAKYIMDRLYNGNPSWNNRFNYRVVPSGESVMTMAKFKGPLPGPILRVALKKSESVMSAYAIQGMTHNGILHVMEKTFDWDLFYNDTNSHYSRSWVVLLTRGPNLIANHEVIDGLLSGVIQPDNSCYPQDSTGTHWDKLIDGSDPTFTDGPLNSFYDMSKRTMDGGNRTKLKFARLAECVVSNVPQFETTSGKVPLRVFELTKLTNTLMDEFTKLGCVTSGICNRSTPRDSDAKFWRVDNKSNMVLTNVSLKNYDVVVIDAPTTMFLSPGQDEYVRYSVLEKWMLKILERYNINFVYKSTQNSGRGQQLRCEAFDIEGWYPNNEYYYLLNNTNKENVSYVPFRFPHSKYMPLTMFPIIPSVPPSATVDSNYEIRVYNGSIILLRCGLKMKINAGLILGVMHVHYGVMPSEPDKKFFGSDFAYHNFKVICDITNRNDPKYSYSFGNQPWKNAETVNGEPAMVIENFQDHENVTVDFLLPKTSPYIHLCESNVPFDEKTCNMTGVKLKSAPSFMPPKVARWSPPFLERFMPKLFSNSSHNLSVTAIDRMQVKDSPISLAYSFFYIPFGVSIWLKMVKDGRIPDLAINIAPTIEQVMTWVKGKLPRRQILYIQTMIDSGNFFKDMKTCEEFIKLEAIFKETTPRLISARKPIAHLIGGLFADEVIKKWRGFLESLDSVDSNIVLMTCGMTGEKLAGLMMERPSSHDTDFSRFDKNVSIAMKIIKTYLYINHIFKGVEILFKCLLWISMSAKLKFCYKKKVFLTLTIWGKTFSGDWDTLLGNTMLTIIYLEGSSKLSDTAIENLRVIGDDAGFVCHNSTRLLEFYCSLLGGILEVTEINGLQSYNSQYALIDASNRPYLLPQTVQACVKKFMPPLPQIVDERDANYDNKFTNTVMGNIIYLHSNCGDPLARRICEILKNNFVPKKCGINEYKALIRKPYKIMNSFNHGENRDWMELYCEQAYGISYDVVNTMSINYNDKDCMLPLLENSSLCKNNFGLDYEGPHHNLNPIYPIFSNHPIARDLVKVDHN
jgi:hypothetical protein